MSLVKLEAWAFTSRGRSSSISYDDLVGIGNLALIEAVSKYNPAKGSQKSYYKTIVKGRMLDAMREEDHVSRSLRDKYKSLISVQERLRHQLQRDPTNDEIAKDLNRSVSWVKTVFGSYDFMNQGNSSLQIELECGVSFNSEHIDIPTLTPSVLEVLIAKENSAELQAYLDSLPPREKRILTLSFFEEYSLKRIGDLLNVTESRVCQLRSKALRSMRESMVNYF
jgi:RNA polymerase sigma factor for flagellar operon FliA